MYVNLTTTKDLMNKEQIKEFMNSPCFVVHCVYLLLITFVIVILLIWKRMSATPSLKGAYLNYSSTNARKNGTLNPSDLAYPQVFEQRKDLIELQTKIKRNINAPVGSKVIVNSGATESIAQCIFWAKEYNQFGIVQGTDYDHSAVKDNCDNYGIGYDSESLRKSKILDNCSMIFLTQINSRNGEILDVPAFKRNVLDKYNYMMEHGKRSATSPYNKHVRQYKPLVVLDATQSMNKVPIDMERWGLDAVFFSLHKMGAPIGLGILVVADKSNTFKPLIAGKQQEGLRGGTFALDTLLSCSYIFDEYDDMNERKERWQQAYDKLTAAGLKVYTPGTNHIYNTLLIQVDKCPLATINDLAEKNIYVGNVSACENEVELEKQKDIKGGKKEEKKEYAPFERSIRISFKKSKELTDEILDSIIAEVKK